MTKIKTTLRRLSELDVKFVSLVDRGANRIPFRIVKNQESQMLNLSTLFRAVKADTAASQATGTEQPVAPEVAALVVQKSEVSAPMLEKLKADLGMSFMHEYEDGTVALSKSESFEDGGTLVRMNENLVLVVKSFEPYSSKLRTLPFDKHLEASTFNEGVRQALGIATDRIQSALWEASTPAEAAKAAKAVLTDCAEYVVALTEALPKEAFYIDSSVAQAVYKSCGTQEGSTVDVEKAAKKPEDAKPAEPDATVADPSTDGATAGAPKDNTPKVTQTSGTEPSAAAADPAEKDVVKPADTADNSKEGETATPESPEDDAEGSKEKDGTVTPVDGKTEDQKSQKEFMDEVLSSIRGFAEVVQTVQALNGGMTNLLKRVDDLSAEVVTFKKATEEKIDSVVQKADTAAQAVQGTVLASDLSGDPTPVTKIQKSDDPRSGVFDTAFIRR